MNPLLVILNGNEAGKRLSLEADKHYIIGRDSGADIVLPEKKISRRHASIVWEADNQRVILEDLRSLNGTYVDGIAVTQPTPLYDKARIQIGSYLLQISISEVDLINAPTEYLAEVPGARSTDLSQQEDAGQIPEDQTGGRLISGKLSELSLPDLLQMLSTTKKTGRLVVSKNKVLFPPDPSKTRPRDIASLYIDEGELKFAEYDDSENEEAFFKLLAWTQGYFSLFPHSQFQFEQMITMPIEALLLDGMRRLDEARANAQELGAEDMLEVQLDEPLTSLEPDQLKVFQIAWKNKSMAAIWKNSPFDKEHTSQIVRDLLKLGFAKKTP